MRVLKVAGGLITAMIAAYPASADAPDARAAAACADHETQADAQRAADTIDADGDGMYCEALPCPPLRPGDDERSAPSELARRPSPDRVCAGVPGVRGGEAARRGSPSRPSQRGGSRPRNERP
jgi:hypothetical protein